MENTLSLTKIDRFSPWSIIVPPSSGEQPSNTSKLRLNNKHFYIVYVY